DAEDLRGRRRVDPLEAERSAQTLGDVAALTADRGLLQGHDIGTERGELLDDELEPLVQVGAVADEPGPWPSVQEVEGDRTHRLRLALTHGHCQQEPKDHGRSPEDRAGNDKIPKRHRAGLEPARPVKRGGRFSRNAATPSARSGVRAAIAWLRASMF